MDAYQNYMYILHFISRISLGSKSKRSVNKSQIIIWFGNRSLRKSILFPLRMQVVQLMDVVHGGDHISVWVLL